MELITKTIIVMVAIIVLSSTAAAFSADEYFGRDSVNKYGYDYTISIDGLIWLVMIVVGLFLLNSVIEWYDKITGPKPHTYDIDAINAIPLTSEEQTELDDFKESDECVYADNPAGLACWKIEHIVLHRATEDETTDTMDDYVDEDDYDDDIDDGWIYDDKRNMWIDNCDQDDPILEYDRRAAQAAIEKEWK